MSDCIAKPRKKRSSKIGPRSRAKLIDGRSVEARLMREHKEMLVEHCGGAPTATQKALIDRATILMLRLHQMDQEAMATGGMAEHAARTYLAWSNSYSRTIRAIGLKAGAQKTTHSLADHLAAKRGAL